MYKTQITPFINCADLTRAIAFYEEYLEFECTFQMEGYAFLRSEAVAIRLLETDCDLSIEEREQMIYIDVNGIDALYEKLRAKLEELPDGRQRAPFDQDYGQREFHVKDEDCTLILFGEAIG
ncbi:MAG: VOC family protein [Pseudomonadota bacterium]